MEKLICDNFNISKKDKLKFVEELGLEKVVDIVLTNIRKNNIQIISDENNTDDVIKKTINSFNNCLYEDISWYYGNNKTQVNGNLLRVFPTGLTISTLISGKERYSNKISLKSPCPIDQWNNDEILKKAIIYVCSHPTKMNTEALSVNRLRVFCMQGHGCRYATSFPVPIAMYIYNKFHQYYNCPIKVIDPCAGWGDRMAACIILGNTIVKSYIGLDPWELSIDVCSNATTTIFKNYKDFPKIKLIQTCAEYDWPIKSLAHIVFTSPPYADLEQYGCSNSETSKNQAWKYIGKDFKTKFLKPMLINAKKAIIPDGRIIININDIPKNNLLEMFLSTVEECDLIIDEIYGLSLSVRAPKTTFEHGSETMRAEPIFILKNKLKF
jgi:hypothetical protein